MKNWIDSPRYCGLLMDGVPPKALAVDVLVQALALLSLEAEPGIGEDSSEAPLQNASCAPITNYDLSPSR